MGRLKIHSHEQIIKEMRGVGKTHLSKRDIDKLPNLSSSTVIREFGTWKNALSAAGLQEGKRTGRPTESKVSFINRHSWRCMLGPMAKNIQEHKSYAQWEVGAKKHIVLFENLRNKDLSALESLMPVSFHYFSEEDVDLLGKHFKIKKHKLPSIYLNLNETLDLRGRKQKSIRQNYNRIDKLDLEVVGNLKNENDIIKFMKEWSDTYSLKYFRNFSGKNLHFFKNEWHRDCINVFIYDGDSLLGCGVLSPPNNKGFSSYIIGKCLYNNVSGNGLSEFLDLSLYAKGLKRGVKCVSLGASFSKQLRTYKNKFLGKCEFNEYEGKILGAK